MGLSPKRPIAADPPPGSKTFRLNCTATVIPKKEHFTISYSPVSDVTTPSGIGGVVAIVHEISTKIVADRRILALRDLGALSVELNQAESACSTAATILASYGKDVPFCLVYLVDDKGVFVQLAGKAGIEDCDEVIRQRSN